MQKKNITAVSYTEKHPAVLQVACDHTNLLAEIAKIYSDYINSSGSPLDVGNACTV